MGGGERVCGGEGLSVLILNDSRVQSTRRIFVLIPFFFFFFFFQIQKAWDLLQKRLPPASSL